jgi:glycosyltransferase involved in cell wall biosynthesis
MRQSFTVHQFHYKASGGDAVTQHMLFIQSALAEIGIGGGIFSVERKNLPLGKIQPWSVDSVWNCDLLLIHHAQGNPVLKDILDLEIPKAIVYHSQAPARFYSHDLETKHNLMLGKKQLTLLKKRGVPVFGVSEFTLDELKRIGFESPQILPLMHLEKIKLEEKPFDFLEPKNLLFVGRIAPHKRQSLLIESFYHLRSQLPAHSKLILIGTGDPLYTKYLKLLIQQWKLTGQVVLAGKLTDQDKESYYELADAFVCLSEHEGFCIPLVEAMREGVPVFYRPSSGVKETMAGAGVQLLSENPTEIAATLLAFLRNEEAQKQVLKQQEKRLKELSKFQNKTVLQAKLLEWCLKIRPISKTDKEREKLSETDFSDARH